MKKIFYTKPSITDLEIQYVSDAIKHGWGENCYEYIHQFENAFSDFLNVKHAIATSSCTGALHMGLSALGIGEGDEVILADTNWIATVAPVYHLGAKPIFVDILKHSWCIDPNEIVKYITPKTKVVIATHLYGNLCQLLDIKKICEEYNLFLVEDAAEALGSEYHKQKVGSIGTFGVFSFHGTKTMTTGEGGMLVTNDQLLYEKVLTLSNHGRNSKAAKQFWPETVGFKYKMSNIQAALGCAQIQRIDELVNRKREILSLYQSLFSQTPDIYLNPEPVNTINSAWMPTIHFGKQYSFNIEKLIEFLQSNNIDARVFFHPLTSLPAVGMRNVTHTPIAYNASKTCLNLPSYHDIEQKELEYVANTIIYFLDNL